MRRHAAFADRGLLTWLVLVLAFLYLPILALVVYSFNSGRFLLNWDGFGGAGYAEALGNRGILDALGVSLRVAVATSIVSVVLGGMAGIALARRPGRWTAPFSALLFLILVAPEIVVAIAYLIFFVRTHLDWGLARIVIGHSIFSSAVVTLIVRARLAGLDPSLEEAAADLGATPARAFRQITLPLLRPALLAGGLLSFTFSLDDVVIAAFVGTAGSSTLPVYVFSSIRTGLKTELAAISALMLGVTLLGLGIAALVLRRAGAADDVVEVLARR